MNNWKYLYLIPIFLMALINNATAQNFGLTAPQKVITLPKSAVPVVKTERKPKVNVPAKLEAIGPDEWKITRGWELAEASKVIAGNQTLFNSDLNTSDWYNATVPGTVLTTLVEQGVYPDPYFGLNNMAIPESLCRTDWWYRTTFSMPKNEFSKNCWLLFNGINYRADIWFNGQLLGTINGAFIRGKFDVTAFLKAAGDNILAVHIYPPNNPGIPHEESPSSGRGPNGGQLCLDGPTFISSEGWDWMPGIRDRNIGIWQDVVIKYAGDVTIENTQIITDLPLPDTTSVAITIHSELVNHSTQKQSVSVYGVLESISFEKTVELNPGEHRELTFSPEQFWQLNLKNPRLWWPNGYGKPALYQLELSVEAKNHLELDREITRFGVREFSYELSVDAPGKEAWRIEYSPTNALKSGNPLFDNRKRRDVGEGVSIPSLRDGIDETLLTEIDDQQTAPYLVIKVNGTRIFCKGGNWGMDDAMKQVSRDHLEPYFKLHRDANFNMVRNWTGESTEEVFYDLCDEYGLLVWNDFWLSTEGYNLNVNDDELFLANATDVIKRFRNHTSIVIWCPRNEGYAPECLEDRLSSLVAREDGTRHYQPNSRYLNLRPSGPWHYFKDATEYFTKNAKGFNTEQGTPSVPTAASMRKMMAKEDVWPISDVWYYHDFHFGQEDYCQAIEQLYGTPKNLNDFCKKAQMVNYDSHRAMFESWNSRIWNNTTGLLLWMTHPAWPSTIWQVYSWDYETFGSYFGVQKACESVHIQMNLDDDQVVVVNTSLHKLKKAKVSLQLFGLDGKSRFHKTTEIDVESNQLTSCFIPVFPANLPDIYLARLELKDNRGQLISRNDYWKRRTKANDFQAFNKLENVTLSGKKIKSVGANKFIQFSIKNTTKELAVAIKLSLEKAGSHEPVLPAYFSAGYFNLLPGESRIITVERNEEDHVLIMAEGYNVAIQQLIEM